MRMWRAVTALAAVGVLGLVTPACGGDDEGGSDNTVTVGITSWHTWYWWLLAAREEGLMDEYGVELDIVTFSDTGQIASGVLSGAVDVGLFAPEQTFTIQQETPDLQIVGSNISTSPYTLLGAGDIDTIEDLSGATIGVTSPGSSADYFTIKLMLESHGLVEGEDYDFVTAGPPSQRAAAMSAGEIQAVANFAPDALILESEGATVLDQAANYDELKGIEPNVYVADSGWYDGDRELAVNFMRGVLKSLDWLYDPANRERAEELLADEMGISAEQASATYERFVLELKAWDPDAMIDPERLEQTRANAVEAGVSDMPEADALEDSYDNSLLEEAAKAPTG
jgi:ABC-type nitrate/sulfonate/bicarbonate transport system substrate-binding protein